MDFMGYRREDGSVGVRNYVVVMSSVACANGVVNAIAREVKGVKPVVHTEGCGRGLADIAISTRTLIGLGRNPNVSSVLVIGLGCEFIKADNLARAISESGKPAVFLVIQDEGGSRRTTQKGIEIARKFLDEANSKRREECSFDKLVVGLKCGGSDGFSGISANPVVGVLSDWLVGEGGTAILSEITEMIGTEKILERRASSKEVGDKIVKLIQTQKETAQRTLGPLASMVISPGNIEGGLSNIKEKALGCIVKGGKSKINEVIDYSSSPSRKGLIVMDGPGSDIFTITGLVASGAQVIVFTTGRGTPVGFPIAPVIKVSSNTGLFNKMRDDIDFNAGEVLEGKSIEETGEKLIELFKRVCNGEPVKAEINQQDVLSINTVEPPF